MLAVWVMYALVGALLFVTYARVPPSELYHVSRGGLAGGASRVLVYLNFPVALAAIALALVAADRLAAARPEVASEDSSRGRPGRMGAAAAVTVFAVVLCAITVLPGVVEESDLDAKLVNALPALGVALALGLTIAAARRSSPALSSRQTGDSIRIALAAVLVLLALPWYAAELGFYLDGPFMGSEVPPGERLAAVHLGHHHGLDGTMFAVAALLLSRTLPTIREEMLRVALGLYLALMLVYGLANVANDAWLEQLVKRGWIDWRIPSVLVPQLTIAWALILVGAGLVWALAFRRLRPVR